MLSRSSYSGIIAMGMTAVIISGGIDLSVGSMMALCGMVAGLVMTQNGNVVPTPGLMVLGTLVGIGMGLLCGLLNGSLITLLNLPPFIVTLGTMSAFRGISYVINNGMMFDVPTYTFLGEGKIADIPVNVLIFLVDRSGRLFPSAVHAAGPVHLRDRLQPPGGLPRGRERQPQPDRDLHAHGPVRRDRAMIATSRTVSAQPTAGISLELDVIAAVVIGGASLSGGRGTVIGTIIGTLLISFLRNGCTLLGISTNIQFVVIGAIIIAAVALDQAARAKAETREGDILLFPAAGKS